MKSKKFLVRERRYQQEVQRVIRLPHSTNEKNVAATLKDGVLTITVKKDENGMPRKIAIN